MINRTKQHKQGGWTIAEFTGVLVISTMLSLVILQGKYSDAILEQTEAQAKLTIEEIKQIQSAAGGYYVDKDKWPDEDNNCGDALATLQAYDAPTTSAAYLKYISTTSPYATPYVTSCDSTGNSTTTFSIQVESDVDYGALYLSALHPNTTLTTTTIANDSTISNMPRPQERVALKDYLLLDGTREMEGDLDMGGHTITNTVDVVLTDGRKLSDANFGSGIKIYTVKPYDYIPKPSCTLPGIPTLHLTNNGIEARGGGFVKVNSAYISSQTAAGWVVNINVVYQDGDGVFQPGDPNVDGNFIVGFALCAEP